MSAIRVHTEAAPLHLTLNTYHFCYLPPCVNRAVISWRASVPDRRLDHVHVDAIVAEVLRRLDRPRFEARTYAVDLEARIQVQSIEHLTLRALLVCVTVWQCCDEVKRL